MMKHSRYTDIEIKIYSAGTAMKEEIKKEFEERFMDGNHLSSEDSYIFYDDDIKKLWFWIDQNFTEKGQWIDVKERLPEKDGKYLVYVQVLAMDGKPYVTVADGHWFYVDSVNKTYPSFGWAGIFDTLKVTKWMPLPKA